MEKEIWKPVVGFEGLYEVSSYGRIKSLYFGKESLLKSTPDKHGYLTVTLCKNKKRKNLKVHRLVALSFIPNDECKNLEINHKDECKSNNHVSNLEWCTHDYNMRYGNIRHKIAKHKSKKVIQFSSDGLMLSEWNSTREIERVLGFKHTHISGCCLGKLKTSYGFIWKYKGI